MGVWVGNDDNTKMGGLTGGSVPAVIWRDIMKVAVESIGSEDFQYPEVQLDGAPKKTNPKLTSSTQGQSNSTRIEDEGVGEVQMVPVTPVTPVVPKNISTPETVTPEPVSRPVSSAPVPAPPAVNQSVPVPQSGPNMN